MSSILVISENWKQTAEISEILDKFNGWSNFFIDPQNFTASELNEFLKESEFHFLVFAKNLDNQSIQELKSFHQNHPQTKIVYYYSLLKHDQFIKLDETGISCCIVGNHQQLVLQNVLNDLWEKHWKRIPDFLLPAKRDELSARTNRIIKFIENKQLKKCNLISIAEHLNISQNQCRTEFKRNIGIYFRDFKKRLFNHYESVLLFEKKFRPKEVCKLLNYKDLSGYSRAFKERHGKSLSKAKSEYRNELNNKKRENLKYRQFTE